MLEILFDSCHYYLYICDTMLNTKETIKDLEGHAFLESDGSKQTYGRVISRVLCRNKHQEAERCIELAMKLLNNDSVEITDSEIKIITEVVKQDPYINNILEYNILSRVSKSNSSSTI